MSEHEDTIGDAIERLEWSDKKSGEVSKFAQVSRRTALTGGAAGLAAVLLEACGSSNNSGTSTAKGASGNGSSLESIFGVKGGYKFTFVNHVTTNTFFTPTISGIKDACKLLNCSYQWTGSTSSNVGQMASAINTAVSAGVDGIATSLIATSLAKSVDAATKAGIPVLSYNADEPNTTRLAYIGQDLLLSGQQMGAKIKTLIPGGGKIMVFIATPGSANLAPRLTGIQQVLNGSNIQVQSQASGAAEPQEVTTIGAFIGKNLDTYKGYFAVDAGSTAAVALAIKKYNLKGKVVGGGFDLTPDTEALLSNDTIQFAIDQQPYLQGFFPTMELFLYKATQGLTGAADVDTGLKFLDPTTIKPYATTKSTYEGTGTGVGVQKAS
jgi:simple sugar transport system substrate-binding protein